MEIGPASITIPGPCRMTERGGIGWHNALMRHIVRAGKNCRSLPTLTMARGRPLFTDTRRRENYSVFHSACVPELYEFVGPVLEIFYVTDKSYETAESNSSEFSDFRLLIRSSDPSCCLDYVLEIYASRSFAL